MIGELDLNERRALRWKARGAVIQALTELGGEPPRSAVIERAAADGDFTQREYEARLPTPAATKYDNPVAHALSWALTNLKEDGLVENPRRGTWRLTEAAALPEQASGGAPVSEVRLVELRRMPYSEYLRTPEWRRTRAAALERARHRCMLDATHRTQLEVHHNTYERLGAELASDLAVLCHSCHRLHHHVNGRPRRAAAAARRLDAGQSRSREQVQPQDSIPPPGWSPTADHRPPMNAPNRSRRGLTWLRRVFAG